MARIKLNRSRLSLPQKIDKARQIVKALTANPDFPTPTPALAGVTTAVDDLDKAAAAAQASRQDAKTKTTDQNSKEAIVDWFLSLSGIKSIEPRQDLNMRRSSLVFAALLSLFILSSAGGAKPPIRVDKITSQCINGVPTITVTLNPLSWDAWKGNLYYHLNPSSPWTKWSPKTNPATFNVPPGSNSGNLQITNNPSSSTIGAGIVPFPVYPYKVATCRTASCVQVPVGFFTSPEVLGELAQGYANCYPQPVCTSPTDLETIQIDGYINYSLWLWTGPSTATFTVAQQNAIIADAISRAGAVTPLGKKIVNITFFRSIITSNTSVSYQIYFTVTFARCSQSQKGMTWIHTASNAQTGTISVGCGSSGPNPCDAGHGDTLCTQQLPLLCIYKPTPPFQLPLGLPNSNQYNLWSGGIVATTQPVAGNAFSNLSASATPSQNADYYCYLQFGPGWRVAEFHDGWGWNFQAYGGTVSAPTVPSTRFWVHINDQPAANCWASP